MVEILNWWQIFRRGKKQKSMQGRKGCSWLLPLSGSQHHVSQSQEYCHQKQQETSHNRENHILECQAHYIDQISLFISEHEIEGPVLKNGNVIQQVIFEKLWKHFGYHHAWLVLLTFRAWRLVTLLVLKYREPYYEMTICPIYHKSLESFSEL